ncbi:unnamed protein product [Moneuplotes crassus]|uniref:Uncharacterized protein n=1 Tax=Euplotes crassus TaxID=5936 RepID=A0AAD2D8T0_EUPCR|nr:unnamed protein product [Moneuplotes crassus]
MKSFLTQNTTSGNPSHYLYQNNKPERLIEGQSNKTRLKKTSTKGGDRGYYGSIFSIINNIQIKEQESYKAQNESQYDDNNPTDSNKQFERQQTINNELRLILLGDKKKKSNRDILKKPLGNEEQRRDEHLLNELLNNMKVTDFNSIYKKSLKIKESLKPQSLLNYKKSSHSTQLSKGLLLNMENSKIKKNRRKLDKEKLAAMRKRTKRLKYLYRKRAKGASINLHTIDRSSPTESRQDQMRRIMQYEHYICRKIGLMKAQPDQQDPSLKCEGLITSIQKEEEKELKELIEYFDKEDDYSRNTLSYKVNQAIGSRNKSVDETMPIDETKDEDQKISAEFSVSQSDIESPPEELRKKLNPLYLKNLSYCRAKPKMKFIKGFDSINYKDLRGKRRSSELSKSFNKSINHNPLNSMNNKKRGVLASIEKRNLIANNSFEKDRKTMLNQDDKCGYKSI